MTRQPVVLLIDDESEEQRGYAAAIASEGLRVILRRPHEVTASDLKSASVVAIDYKYRWSDLPHPSQLAYWPIDGLAVAGVISRHLAVLNTRASVILRSGAVGELAGELPAQVRVPLLAGQNGLDWILEKGSTDTAENIRQLADATAALEPFLTPGGSEHWNEGAEWLRLPRLGWEEAALAEIQVCRPPEHIVASFTSGSAWLRWFTQRILPFPSFLISNTRAATLLHMSTSQFQSIVNDEVSEFGHRIRKCAYTGHLAGLVENRWWRAGLDKLIDDLLAEGDGSLSVPEALSGAYSSLHGSPVEMLPHESPVVTIDADYREESVAEFSECVRLAPDGWPVFADEPFALRGDAEGDPELGLMVSRGDRGRLARIGVLS